MDLIVVGLGWAGLRHAQAIRAVASKEDVRLAAVVDPDREHRAGLLAELGEPAAYDTLGEALAAHQGAAVVLATPHALHRAGAEEAAGAGRAVLVEKPIAPTLADADAMIDACGRAGVTLMVAESARYNLTSIRLAEVVAAGRLGQPLAGRLSFVGSGTQQYGYPGRRAWLSRPELGGSGVWLLNGIHHVSLARMLLGEVSRITAHEVRSDELDAPGVEASVMALLRFDDGAAAHLTSSVELRGFKRFRDVVIFGSAGTAWTDLRDPQRVSVHHKDADEPEVIDCREPDTGGAPAHFVRQMREFIDAVRCGRTPATSGPEERATLAVIEAGYESMRSGATVVVDRRSD